VVVVVVVVVVLVVNWGPKFWCLFTFQCVYIMHYSNDAIHPLFWPKFRNPLCCWYVLLFMVDKWNMSSSPAMDKLQCLFHKQIKIQVFWDIQTCQLLSSSNKSKDQVSSIPKAKQSRRSLPKFSSVSNFLIYVLGWFLLYNLPLCKTCTPIVLF
jgi:hypothetical protein